MLLNPDGVAALVAGAQPGTLIRVAITIQVPPSSTTPEPAGVSEKVDLLEAVERVRAETGDEPVKLKDWARRLPSISARKLKEAAVEGSLQWISKPEGRDNGAWMATPDAMAEYLKSRPAKDVRSRRA